jgi:hypothetical protein
VLPHCHPELDSGSIGAPAGANYYGIETDKPVVIPALIASLMDPESSSG